MFLKTDAVSFKIMNYTPCLSQYRHIAKEIYRNSFSCIAIETVIIRNYNNRKDCQKIIGVKKCYK